jgi:hypothetical protein
MSVTYADVITVDFGTRQRGPAPLLRTRLPEIPAQVVTFAARCPSWCTIDGPHRTHIAALACLGVQTPGRADMVTVMLQNTTDGTVVNLRALTAEEQIGANLDAAALDEVIAALTTARRLMAAHSPRSSSQGGGRVSTPVEAS